ncbi:hypothetical protein A3A76_01170 [Candidatus Woesebacteria bacterium RIFCSPLOWO2_01_FULL_39_23]|uniref:Methyltransferase type 11 domain-containing protein n=1 Tax=Candidatus Woesebacteria bacterium RIFCSPHIGHO2_01_FULL_40_22 TaxID=1802499 RepID=A0A1F7YEX4_9BACT|nr:MAG: hypothetical protein A2141_04680 [Candidatus Woesebacteria bacterium RBG_16_40_11]OGM25873.1 MAG: hypothetical protein A2628_04845 [Candidatus Woesebacteria bacterium RIFCSPHIGHO2_01_FULL_40_22]OGM36251.1 MAG: hypothetical protein A3E41_02575 [Candidatus Woesebacteria bacterium RIFCSPHIGHO2_12_FULL_38_9]OGM61627.1 MAG: hypothetical protein A3A76_01170 [Candidatus Woesebacteria bacterium RIFCSPLOWO2_01_FULL_39_23]
MLALNSIHPSVGLDGFLEIIVTYIMRKMIAPFLFYFLRKIGYPKHLLKYKDYESIQKNRFCSFESENKLWVKGQIKSINKLFKNVSKRSVILDIACGDGSGLKHFKKLGFNKVVGVEFNHVKAAEASKVGYKVYENDMHDLRIFNNHTFDYIYSSHTLEHAFDLKKATKELFRILKKDGQLIVILPYPDREFYTIKAHPAKFDLGLDKEDKGKSVVKYFENNGFVVKQKAIEYYRQPEIQLILLRKKSRPSE